MKERPILFSAPMVRAILDGRKTQTRRAIKPQPEVKDGEVIFEPAKGDFWVGVYNGHFSGHSSSRFGCPYGKIGDQLWVRETFYAFGYWQKNATDNNKWHFVDLSEKSGRGYKYADSEPHAIGKRDKWGNTGWFKRPSLFMPRAASRITLEITNIRVERLNQISEADAIAEGIESFRPVPGDGSPETLYRRYSDVGGRPGKWFSIPELSFKSLWESINGSGSFGEQWVWVVEFKQI